MDEGTPDTEAGGLVARIRDGEHAAFETLFRTYYASLRGYAISLLGAPELADDVVCDVFAKIWHNRRGWRPPAGPRPYLITAVRNRCMNAVRDDHHRRQLLAARTGDSALFARSADPDILEHLSRQEQLDAVRAVIGAMPPVRREAARLRWVDRLEYREIATILGVTEKTVRQHISLALGTLRQHFGSRIERSQ